MSLLLHLFWHFTSLQQKTWQNVNGGGGWPLEFMGQFMVFPDELHNSYKQQQLAMMVPAD